VPEDAVRRRGLAIVRRVLRTGRGVCLHGDGLQLRVDPVTDSFVFSFVAEGKVRFRAVIVEQ